MSHNAVLIDLNDPRTVKLAEVISNATCKRILALLAEHDLSESELAHRLNAPLNTINYNMKKLVAAGLVSSVRSLWSSKGRAVKVYRVSRKNIVISPRALLRGVLPVSLVALAATFGVRTWELSRLASPDVMKVSGASLEATSAATDSVAAPLAQGLLSHFWFWFLAGAALGIAALFMWNWLRD